MSKFTETKQQAEALQNMLSSLKNVDGPLMMALQKAQEIYGYLPFEVQNRIADFFDIPVEELYGITTFYSQFHLQPRGKYTIGVCMGTACYVRGSGEILDKLKSTIKLEPGKTSEDMKFSLEATRCIGCCGLAPVLTVNEDVYGNVKADDIVNIVKKYND